MNPLKKMNPDHRRWEGVESQLDRPYCYWHSSNGVFIEVDAPVVKCKLPIRGWKNELPGLAFLHATVSRPFPLIRESLLLEMIGDMRRHGSIEIAYQIVMKKTDHSFRLIQTGAGTAATVVSQESEVEPDECIIADVHSHHGMAAYYSPIDIHSHQGVRWFVVVGRLNQQRPSVRVAIYAEGAFVEAPPGFLFSKADMAVGSPLELSGAGGRSYIIHPDDRKIPEQHARKFCSMRWQNNSGMGVSTDWWIDPSPVLAPFIPTQNTRRER